MKLSPIGTQSRPFDRSTRLYRYISYENTKYLQSSGLTFTRVKSWPDRFEAADFEFFKEAGRFKSDRQPEHFFASCWTFDQILQRELSDCCSLELANKEMSEKGVASMWENYCQGSGIRISTTLGKILDSLSASSLSVNEVVFGPVIYCSWMDNVRLSNLNMEENSFFFKSPSFRHEAEFRFLLHSPDQDGDYINVSLNSLSDFLDEILVAPIRNAELLSKAKQLYQEGTSIRTSPDYGYNTKNGIQFCRVSQLYKVVQADSEGVSLVD